MKIIFWSSASLSEPPSGMRHKIRILLVLWALLTPENPEHSRYLQGKMAHVRNRGPGGECCCWKLLGVSVGSGCDLADVRPCVLCRGSSYVTEVEMGIFKNISISWAWWLVTIGLELETLRREDLLSPGARGPPVQHEETGSKPD